MLDASPQAIDLNPRYSGQAHSKRSRTASGNKNMEYGCAFRVFRAPFIIRPLSHADV